jgi:7-keto-8-aminopelargonate synthetase-like enzyme
MQEQKKQQMYYHQRQSHRRQGQRILTLRRMQWMQLERHRKLERAMLQKIQRQAGWRLLQTQAD